jgi:hypothetical protein
MIEQANSLNRAKYKGVFTFWSPDFIKHDGVNREYRQQMVPRVLK